MTVAGGDLPCAPGYVLLRMLYEVRNRTGRRALLLHSIQTTRSGNVRCTTSSLSLRDRSLHAQAKFYTTSQMPSDFALVNARLIFRRSVRRHALCNRLQPVADAEVTELWAGIKKAW